MTINSVMRPKLLCLAKLDDGTSVKEVVRQPNTTVETGEIEGLGRVRRLRKLGQPMAALEIG